ncbi:MAG: tRNA (adenosine(37)-N6)-threonylcarbamoyltransferase complex dimerization subunit type 1 TsaB [Chloroflexi bacterium]|nr:MAG: tRNA (adenosine(37)-N6)-threonylcarbamoyltransferase complex dimerization subunit type 1 TsaB [Chloroflexota bacterium]
MILLLDTSTSLCRVTLLSGDQRTTHEWQADRELARGLLKYITSLLNEQDLHWSDVSGIGAFKGPGSFTGLRIGLTVVNTLADSLKIPIVGAIGQTWSDDAIRRLDQGANDKIVLPEYGAAARITQPRK